MSRTRLKVPINTGGNSLGEVKRLFQATYLHYLQIEETIYNDTNIYTT